MPGRRHPAQKLKFLDVEKVRSENEVKLRFHAVVRSARLPDDPQIPAGIWSKCPFWHPLQHRPAGIAAPKVAEMLDLAARACARTTGKIPCRPIRAA
jgi:hypothetical protein